MGLLNQRAIEYFVRKRGSPFRGGYYSRGSAVLSDVPVPELDLVGNFAHVSAHDAIVQNVRDIMDLKSKLAAASGRTVTQLQRRLQVAQDALEKAFRCVVGICGSSRPDSVARGVRPRSCRLQGPVETAVLGLLAWVSPAAARAPVAE